MKKTILILLIGLIFSNLYSQTDSLQQLIETANKLYSQNKYSEALENYQKVLQKGYVSSELYYNIGNAYFKLNNLPYAILYYEKALHLDPRNHRAKNNLEYVYTLLNVDNRENLFILDRIYLSILKLFSSNGWAIISLIFFVLAFLLGLLFFLSKRITVRRNSLIFGIILLILSLSALWLSYDMQRYQSGNNEAIIMQTTTVKSSPSETGTEIFVVNPGIKVKILSSDNQWVEVRLPNGKSGWVEANKMEKL